MIFIRPLLYCLTLFLVGCAAPHPLSNKYVTVFRSFDGFDSIENRTDLNIHILTQQQRSGVVLKGPATTLDRITTQQKGNKLILAKQGVRPMNENQLEIAIKMPASLHGLYDEGRGHVYGQNIKSHNLHVKTFNRGNLNLSGDIHLKHMAYGGYKNIRIDGLRSHRMKIVMQGGGNVELSGQLGVYQVTHSGTGQLTLKGVKSEGLQVSSTGSGSVNLVGAMNLQTLGYTGKGRVNIKEINSNNLALNGAGTGRIILAGHAKRMHAILSKKTILDASQLEVTRAYINTSDKAVAKVKPTQVLNALATRQSNIYYYTHPDYIADYSRHMASVIYAGSSDFCTNDSCTTAYYPIG